LSGYTNGLPQWDWGSNNGTWNTNWISGSSAGNCCFPKKVSNSDGNADRIRVRVVGCTTTGYSSTVLIKNRWNEAPSSLSRNVNNVCPGTSVTLTASFPAAINMNGTVDFYSGSCGGTLVGSVAGNGSTSISTNISAPSSTTNYYARYNPGSGTSCSVSGCVSTTLTINFGAPTAISATWGDCVIYKARWNAVAGATGYRIDVSTNSSFTNIIENNVYVSGTSYDLDYPPGTVLYYRVRAVNACFTSGNSNWIGVTIPTPSNNDLIKNATDITAQVGNGGTYSGSFNNDSYGTESGEPLPNGTYSSAWYKFTTGNAPLSNVDAYLTSTGNSDNEALAIYRSNGNCPFGSLTNVEDNWNCAGTGYTISESCLASNTTYFIQFGTQDCTLDNGDRGNYNVSITTLPGAPDNICDAVRVGSGDIGVNQSATTSTYLNSCSSVNTGGHTDPSNAQSNNATDWFYFTTPSTVPSQYYFRFWNIGDFGTWGGMEGEVYKQTGGTCPPTLQYIGSWDPDACGVEEESGGFCLDPNSTYYIMAPGIQIGFQDQVLGTVVFLKK